MHSTPTAARFWDRIARKYATDPIKDMAGYERTIERTRQLLGAGDRVVEIGCGTGTTALRLAPHVAAILASDVSREMIAIADEKAAAERCGNVRFLAALSEEVPADEAPFDVALVFNVLHLMADRPSAYACIHRLVKPGGLLVTKTPCLSEMNPLIRLAVPVARWLGKAPDVSFFTAAGLELEMASAGFEIVERARHGSARRDPRIFIVARRPR